MIFRFIATGINEMFNTLKIKITVIISLVVLVGGLIAALIGSYSVSNTLKQQAFEKIRHDIQSAYALYQFEGEKINSTIRLLSEVISSKTGEDPLNDRTIITNLISDYSLSFLTIIDQEGEDVFSKKKIKNFTMLIDRYNTNDYSETIDSETLSILIDSDPSELYIKVIDTPYSFREERKVLKDALAITAISRFRYKKADYYLYGGIILNKNFEFVDKIREIIFSKEFYKGKPVGTVTLFSGPVRITTNVILRDNIRAIGTVIQDVVGDSLLNRNESYTGRAFVVNSWYLGAYQPLPTKDGSKAVIYVGLSESVYESIRINLILKFLFIAIISFILIIILTYLLVSRITRPLKTLSEISLNISRGDFSRRPNINSRDEIGKLSNAFNQMIDSILESKKMLEEYNQTLKKKVEERTEELMKIKEQMIQSEKLASIGRLSAGVAHEINNPIGAVLSYAHLIREELRENRDITEINKYAEQIITETNRAKNIVKNLLEFSRQHQSVYEWVDINQIVEDSITLITIQKKPDNISIIRNYGKDIPIIKIDPEKIKEALINIIINALDAMAENGTLEIQTTVDHRKQRVSISISDTGSGIPDDILGHIFEPFFTTKPAGEGTGLGLSVTYGIVKQHNGDITVETKVGAGTRFTILLPLHP